MRLNLNTLATLPEGIQRPAYDPSKLGVGIVHLGLGAFHRAHQAVYTDAAIAANGGDWGICAVSLKTRTTCDQLAPQDGLYSVRTVSEAGDEWRVMGSIREVLFAPDQMADVIARIARAETKIITLTVTEKGYCADVPKREPLWDHADIANDLLHADTPCSVLGVLAAGLHERFRKRGAPLTILCCDNLPENGAVLESLVHQFVARLYPLMLPWLRDNVRFPSSMVDRIVPATRAEDRADAALVLGVVDEGVVRAEPFSQWVIEDNFAAERPAWEQVGAQLVADVRPFEKMKLRLLNGSHSLMAYLGYVAGYETINETVIDPGFERLVNALMLEAEATLEPITDVDFAAYRAQLMERFSNAANGHRCAQIACDGSQKIPQRWIAVANERLAKGLDVGALTLATAGWIRYVYGKDELDETIIISDPLAAEFAAIAAKHSYDALSFADAILRIEPVFGALGRNPAFAAPVKRWVNQLFLDGAQATVDSFSEVSTFR
ncbi:MAG: mannitol dehydrogenase family protein [Casimicrobium sp.]